MMDFIFAQSSRKPAPIPLPVAASAPANIREKGRLGFISLKAEDNSFCEKGYLLAGAKPALSWNKFPERTSVQHRMRIRHANQFRVEVEIKIQTAIAFWRINGAGHEQIGGVVVPFGLHQAGVKTGQLGIKRRKFARQNLKFFAASPFDQGAADQMIDHLRPLTIPDRAHQARNP